MLDEQLIASLKAKHPGPLAYVEAEQGELVFRKPTRDEYERFQDKMAADNGNVTRHLRELASCCLVHPNAAALHAAMEAEPALLVDDIAPLIHELAGMGKARAKGKL